MKSNWQSRKLGEICNFEGGSQPPKSEFIYESRKGYVRFLQIRDFTSDNHITYIPDSNKNRLCDENDILIGRYGASVGKILINKKGAYNVALIKTKPDTSLLDKGFLFYYLISDEFQKNLSKVTARSAQAGFSKEDIYDFCILTPSVSEQRHIVAILEKDLSAIDEAKQNSEKNLQNVRNLYEYQLRSVFNKSINKCERKTLKQISVEFGRGKSKHRPRNDNKLYGGEYPFIQTGNIRGSEHYITEYSQTYNKRGLAQSKLWPKGTICITIAANIAETGILGFDACFPDSIIGLVVDSKLADINFVEYLLQSFKSRLQSKGKGSAQANINLATFENELFPYPSLSEQRIIASNLEALSTETKKLETIYQKKLASLEELKKSILQKAFNGELT